MEMSAVWISDVIHNLDLYSVPWAKNKEFLSHMFCKHSKQQLRDMVGRGGMALQILNFFTLNPVSFTYFVILSKFLMFLKVNPNILKNVNKVSKNAEL